jgi:hypothetical protein
MTDHKDLQDPQDYQNEDYKTFEQKLFSELTPVSELQEICMTLAHLPTKRAQELLAQFRQSERASEVEWLECAVDEGQFHYLSPENEQEEYDLLTLKVIQELEDAIVDLQIKYDEGQLFLKKRQIEHDALLELIKQGELDEEEALGFEDFRMVEESQLEDLAKKIAVKEKTVAQLKKSIQTAKYQNVDMTFIRHIHFS